MNDFTITNYEITMEMMDEWVAEMEQQKIERKKVMLQKLAEIRKNNQKKQNN